MKKRKSKLNKKRASCFFGGITVSIVMMLFIADSVIEIINYHYIPIYVGLAFCAFMIVCITWIIVSDAIEEDRKIKMTLRCSRSKSRR